MKFAISLTIFLLMSVGFSKPAWSEIVTNSNPSGIEYDAEHDREILDELYQEYDNLDDKIKKLESGMEYKQSLRDRYFEELEVWLHVESGEITDQVTSEESKKMIAEGIKGVKKYLTTKGKDRLKAAENALNQVKSLKNIYAQQDRYFEASERVKQIVEYLDVLEQQISKREGKIEVLKLKQSEIEKEIDERTTSFSEIMNGIRAWWEERLEECRSYRADLIDEITGARWNRKDVETCTGEGKDKKCSSRQITECLANSRKICAGTPPFGLCTCSTQTPMRFNVVVQQFHCGPLPPL